jgi:rhodanese-related sulfurtransferase
MVQTTLRTIEFDDALDAVDRGAAFLDLRELDDYLEVHVPGSLGLGYEFGPGMPGRARDCIPLSVPVLLLRSENANLPHAAASLRGKGFNVVGVVDDALNQWAERGKLITTELTEGPVPPGEPVVDVGDAGRRRHADALEIPIETLWSRVDDLSDETDVTVLCGRALRAALAVGMFERVGVETRLWRNSDGPGGF